MIKFTFDLEDYRNMPGLFRVETDRPNLAPVFFDIECLIYYFDSPKHRCSLAETYGTIYHDKNSVDEEDKDFDISFGINRNKKVIMWLGDLEKLSIKQQMHLASFNIESDHDIASQFYDAHVLCVYPERINEAELLLQKAKINEFFRDKLRLQIFQTEYTGLEYIFDEIRKYRKIVFNNKDDFKIFINEWKGKLIEDFDLESLRKYLFSKGVATINEKGNELGGIKLFEKVLSEFTIGNIIAPYFALKDLRDWADHDESRKSFYKAMKTLAIKEEDKNDYEAIYKELILNIVECNNKILSSCRQ